CRIILRMRGIVSEVSLHVVGHDSLRDAELDSAEVSDDMKYQLLLFGDCVNRRRVDDVRQVQVKRLLSGWFRKRPEPGHVSVRRLSKFKLRLRRSGSTKGSLG